MLNIFLFELKYRIKRPATWAYFAIFFLFAFLIMVTDKISINGGTGNMFRNAPAMVESYIAIFMAFGMLVISAVMGNPVFRDYEHNTHHFLFSYPFGKWEYLLGRFLGSMVICCVIFLSLPLGLGLGATLSPLFGWMPAERFCSNPLLVYLVPYLIYVIPNTLFVGAIFFGITSLTKKITYTYLFNVVLFMGYLLALNKLTKPENMQIAAILDPFGIAASQGEARYWTPTEINSQIVGLAGLVKWNRALWTTIGLLIFAVSGYFFDFKVNNKQKKIAKNTEDTPTQTNISVPKVALYFSGFTQIQQMLSYGWISFRDTVRELPFIGMVVSGLAFILFQAGEMDEIFGTPTYPVSYNILEITKGLFGIFMLIIITYYSGELVWKERALKMNQIYDALPIKNWLLFGSKVLTMALIVLSINVLVMITAIVIQVIKGGAPVNWELYFIDTFYLSFKENMLLAILAIFIQTLVPNKFTGHAVMLLYYIWGIVSGSMGLENPLYRPFSIPGYQYSDMNGFGSALYKINIFIACWGMLALVFLILGNALWVRGTVSSWKERFQVLKKRMNVNTLALLSVCLIGFFTLSGFIYYNTNVLNKFVTSDEQEVFAVKYEKEYQKYKKTPQPKFTRITLDMDLKQKELSYHATGEAVAQNKTQKVIDSIVIEYNALLSKIDIQGWGNVVLDDKDLGFRIYKLAKPLQPGDSVSMKYDILMENKGFSRNGQPQAITYNGTFIHSYDYFPTIGYTGNSEVSDKNKRTKLGLPKKKELPNPESTEGLDICYLGSDADWIMLETTIHTEKDQTALAPGYLEKEWEADGRRHFTYKMDAPMKNFYSVLSAKFETKKEKWNGINLEIYYHKGHEYNIDRMMQGMKDAIQYAGTNFTPYQYRQARIIEFPRYESFAQSFPNTIPYSEGIGFIADLRDSTDIDYIYYVTAHEIAHQWWGHQITPSSQKGGDMLCESMAQYTALMIMKHKYGADKMRKFLHFELDRYLRGRKSERDYENPLYKCSNQQYIHYRKGSVVFYALQDYWGEANVNAALKKFVTANQYRANPYTNSIAFLDTLKRYTPDSLQYLYKDMFETITLYDNRATSAKSEKMPDGKYKVTIDVEANKFLADSLGKESPLQMNDYVDIGVLGKGEKYAEKQLFLQKYKIKNGKNKFEIIVAEEPKKAGIDVYNKLIDRDSDDNVVAVE